MTVQTPKDATTGEAVGAATAGGPAVSVIVISYNTRDMTVACLRSVFDETDSQAEVVVVDNASTDGSVEAIRKEFPADAYPSLKLVAEETNHGFARAHDVAVPHATAPWLLLLNPDTVVLDHAIDRLLEGAEATPDAGIWGGRTLFADRSLNPTSAWAGVSLWSTACTVTGVSSVFRDSALFNPEGYGGWDRGTPREVDIVTGCFFLIRRADWDRLGGFDPDFVMYGEEADLCHRARKLGFRPRIVPEATIVHYGGASETVRADKLIRVIRAKVELAQRHIPAAKRKAAIAMLVRWPWSRWRAWQALARMGREGAAEKAATWGEVWARRDEWRHGVRSKGAEATAVAGVGAPRKAA